MKKFLDSDWLKAVQFFLNKVQKAKQSAKIVNKIQIAKKIENITLLEFQNFEIIENGARWLVENLVLSRYNHR